MDKNINEILCQSIDTIVMQRISEMEFDKTIVCTIVDDSQKNKGYYQITDNGIVIYDAYSENTSYNKGDKVYVSFPKDQKEKCILGRYTSDRDLEPITYVKPFETVMPTTGIKGTSIARTSLTASGINASSIKLGSFSFEDANYDTFCLKAEFKSLLQNYNIKSGHYGLKAIVSVALAGSTELLSCSLDSEEDMFGNPYAFTAYFEQQQIYGLTLGAKITNVDLYFYQSGDFQYRDEDGNLKSLNVEIPNIFIQNIECFCGLNVANIKDNTVQIFTTSSNKFTIDNTIKNLSLLWYNKTEQNVLVGFTDGEFDLAAKQPLAPDDSRVLYYIDWEYNDWKGSWINLELGVDGVSTGSDGVGQQKINLDLSTIEDINSFTEFQVRAIVWCNGEKYESESTLSFWNANETAGADNLGVGSALSIINSQYSYDCYPFYGGDGQLINIADGWTTRYVKWEFDVSNAGMDLKILLQGAKLKWILPSGNTMLHYAPGFSENEITLNFNEDGTLITEEGDYPKELYFGYNISSTYVPIYNNNTITCEIVDAVGNKYSASKNFIFSSYGNSGTDFTLIVYEREGKPAYVDGHPMKIAASLYDADMKLVEGAKIKYNYGQSIDKLLPADDIEASSDDYSVLTATTSISWVGNSVVLQSKFAVPYSSDANYYYQGPTTIMYNSNGTNPTYYRGDIKLFDKSDNDNEVPDITWSLAGTGYNSKDSWSLQLTSLPYRLKAPNMFLTGSDTSWKVNLIGCNSSGQVVWKQPLIIGQNTYASSILNNWDGSVKIGDSYILAPLIGAGTKNTYNEFSGVVMGSFGTQTDNSLGKIGLYGYKEGAESYGFNVDGTAFIGTSGEGRIYFDGENGVIAGPDWWTQNNTYVDLYKNNQNILTPNSNIEGGKFDFAKGHLELYGNDNGKRNYLVFRDGKLLIQTDNFTLGSTGNTIGEQITIEINNGISSTVTDINESIGLLNTNISQTAGEVKLQADRITSLEAEDGILSDRIDSNTAEISVQATRIDSFVSSNTGRWDLSDYEDEIDKIQFGYGAPTSETIIKDGMKYYLDNATGKIWENNGDPDWYEHDPVQLKLILDPDQFATFQQQTNKSLESLALTTSYYAEVIGVYDTVMEAQVNVFDNWIQNYIKEDINSSFPEGLKLALKLNQLEGVLPLELQLINGYDKIADEYIPLGITQKIYYKGQPLSDTNTYPYNPNAIIMLTFENGHWSITDNGSYSQILQTADSIEQSVTDLNTSLSSKIKQTAGEITSSVGGLLLPKVIDGFTITYYGNGAPETDAFPSDQLKINDAYLDLLTGDIYQYDGEGGWSNEGWTDLSNYSFTTYQNQTNSMIQTLAASSSYYAESETGASTAVKDCIVKTGLNVIQSAFTQGATISVKFTNGINITNSGFKIQLKKENNNIGEAQQVYLMGKESFDFEIGDNSIIFFTYNGSGWDISDGGSYSQFTILSDKMNAYVAHTHSPGKTGGMGWVLTPEVFKIYKKDSANNETPLFQVMQNGDAIISGNVIQGNLGTSGGAYLGKWKVDGYGLETGFTNRSDFAGDSYYYVTRIYGAWPETKDVTIAGVKNHNWRMLVGSRLSSYTSNDLVDGYTYNFGITREGYLCATSITVDGRSNTEEASAPLGLTVKNGALVCEAMTSNGVARKVSLGFAKGTSNTSFNNVLPTIQYTALDSDGTTYMTQSIFLDNLYQIIPNKTASTKLYNLRSSPYYDRIMALCESAGKSVNGITVSDGNGNSYSLSWTNGVLTSVEQYT